MYSPLYLFSRHWTFGNIVLYEHGVYGSLRDPAFSLFTTQDFIFITIKVCIFYSGPLSFEVGTLLCLLGSRSLPYPTVQPSQATDGVTVS